MPAGLEIINDSGTILIDDSHFNLVLTATGTVNSISSLSFWANTSGDPPEGSDSNLVYFLVPYSGDYPLVAVRGPSGVPIFPIKHYGDQSGANRVAAFYCVGTTARTLTYYVFGRVPANDPNVPSYGLVVYNAAGQITYHSQAKAFRVDGLLGLYQSNANASFALDAGRSYAVAFSSPHLGEYQVASVRGQKLGIELTTASNTGYIRPGNWWFQTPIGAHDYPAGALLLDVTGF